MNARRKNNTLLRQRLSMALALLFCLTVTSLEYVSDHGFEAPLEHQDGNSQNQEQTFLNVAVDAVVPFAVEVSQTVFYLIYEIIDFEGKFLAFETSTISLFNSHIEILFERIISPQGP